MGAGAESHSCPVFKLEKLDVAKKRKKGDETEKSIFASFCCLESDQKRPKRNEKDLKRSKIGVDFFDLFLD